jgi:diguanylate cyclase (GGDEF)-like protein
MDALPLGLLLIAATFSLLLAIFVWTRRTAPGTSSFGWLMLAVTIWSLSYVFFLASPTPILQLFWVRMSYVGIVAVPALWLILTVQFAGPHPGLRPWHGWLLLVEPILVLVLIWTNPWHGWFWSKAYTSYQTSDPGHAIAFGVHAVYSYTLLGIGTLLLILVIQRSPRVYRGQGVALLLGALAPWAGNVVYVLNLSPFGNVDLTPFLFAFSSPVLAWGFFHSDLLGGAPIGYDAIIETMDDQVLVLDHRLRLVAANQASASVTGRSPREMLGKPAGQVFSAWPELLALLQTHPRERLSLSVESPAEGQFFNIRIFPLSRSDGRLQGKLVIFHNETEHQVSEESLRATLAETKALYNVSRSLTAATSLSVMLQTIVDEVAAALPADRVLLVTFDQERQAVTNYIKGGPGQANIEDFSYQVLMDGLSGWVIRNQKPAFSRKGEVDERESSLVRQQRAASGVGSVLVAPLLYQGRILGTITAANRANQSDHSQKDVDLLMALANGAAAGVETARLLLSERQQRERAEILGEVAGILNASLEQEQLLTLILEQLSLVVEYDSASIMLIQDDHSTLSIAAHRGSRSDEQLMTSRQIHMLPHIHKVLTTHQTEIIEDTQQDERWNDMHQSENVRCWLGAPLLVQYRVIGLLNLNREQPNSYTNQDGHFVQGFANQAAIAIENARLYEAARLRAQEAEMLRQATTAVTSSLDQQEAIQLILQTLEKVVAYDSASVQLLRDDCLEVVGGRGWHSLDEVLGLRFPVPANNPNTPVIQQRKPQIINDTVAAYPELFGTGYHSQVRSWLGVPLLAHDCLIGMLALDSSEANHFTENDARLVSAFADQVAIAIENARLYSVERQQVQESDALRATVSDISAELELPRLLQSIMERATSLLNATGGDLGLYDENRGEIEIVISYNMGLNYQNVRMALGEGAMGQVALSLEPLMIENYSTWEQRSNQYNQGSFRAVLAVPMLIGGRLVGVLGIVDAHPTRQFTTSDQRLLILFAQQAAIAVENARLYQSAREAAERRAVLHQVSQEIVRVSLDPEGIYRAIHQAASQLMTTEAFVVTLLDEQAQMIDAVYVVDHAGRAPQHRFELDQGLSGHVISSGQPALIRDVIGELEDSTSLISQSVPLGDDEEVRSLIAVPMRLGSKVTGMLSAQSYRTCDYSEDDLHILEMLASYAAIALENTRLFRELQKLAIYDPLTEVYNRRHLYELGQREFSRARRFGRSLSAIMLDIDHFKQVNDRFGHAVGDVVLHTLAARIHQSVREVDIVGRYGGEEFLLILPETELASALVTAERVRSESALPMPVVNGSPLCLSVSIGVASLNTSFENLAELVAAADTAQYEAKNQGRNRVIAHQSQA